MTNTKYIAITKEYRDAKNGNSYFSTRIEDVQNDRMFILPFQYGYGSQSEYEVKRVINGFNSDASWNDIKFIKLDRCQKKEVIQHGKGSEDSYISDLGFYYQD